MMCVLKKLSLPFACLVLSFSSGLAHAADSPSFDCKKASSSVEKAICGDPKLMELDVDLAASYKRARSESSEKRSKWIVSSQREWLKERNNCPLQGMQGCLVGRYTDRLAALELVLGWNTLTPKLPIGWKIDGKIIPPQCFSTIWVSGANYAEFADRFSIDTVDLMDNPGKYFGKDIPDLKAIISSWDYKIYRAASLEECFKGNLTDGGFSFGGVNYNEAKNTGIEINDKDIHSTVCTDDDVGSCFEYSYRIWSKISLGTCKQLAPHLSGKCEESYLISVGYQTGGSMGWAMSHTIYGLFTANDSKKFIVPLKNFYSEEAAIKYIKWHR